MKLLISLSLIFIYISPSVSQAQSIDLDKELGAKNAALVESQMGIYADKEQTDFIRRVGERLVSKLEKPLFEYQFHIVPDMSPNAFALPGGYIYITTGIIPLLETEDELAGILGHEIIHSNNRHTIRQAKKSIIPKLFEIPGNLIGAISYEVGELINAPIKGSNSLLFASYSRKFETEADDDGVVLAAKAGYDPSQLPNVLIRMNVAIEAVTGQKEKKSYLADHPYTPDRNKNLIKQAAKTTIVPSPSISKNFLMEFDGVLFGESPGKGIIRENAYLHPDINFYVEFPKGWVIDNQPDAVKGYHPDGKAVAFVSLTDASINPEEAGKQFVSKLGEEYKSKIEIAKVYEVNSHQGYLVSFTEDTKKDKMYAYILWLPMNGYMYKLIGIAPIEYREQLENSAKSLRVLTKNEKASIKETYVKVVKALKGESLAGLSKRTGNKLNLELTAIINLHVKGDILKKDELIKIVLDKPYLEN